MIFVNDNRRIHQDIICFRITKIWPFLMLKSCSGQEHLDYSITVHRLTGKEAKKLMGFLTGNETCSHREGRTLGEKDHRTDVWRRFCLQKKASSR